MTLMLTGPYADMLICMCCTCTQLKEDRQEGLREVTEAVWTYTKDNLMHGPFCLLQLQDLVDRWGCMRGVGVGLHVGPRPN